MKSHVPFTLKKHTIGKENKLYKEWMEEVPPEKVSDLTELSQKIVDLYDTIEGLKKAQEKTEEENAKLHHSLAVCQKTLAAKENEIEGQKQEISKYTKNISELKELSARLARENEKMGKVVQISNM